MKIVLLRNGRWGPALPALPVAALVGCVLALCIAAVWWRPGTAPRAVPLDARVAEDATLTLRRKLAEQQAEFAKLEARAVAESHAVGRQLAQMQARLLRMEALGSRVTETIDLGENEFDFDAPAAVGGPVPREEAELPWHDLHGALDDLSGKLYARETELAILEGLLHDKDYHDGLKVTHRPVKWGWLSSPYGQRVDPISGKQSWHKGVDFAGREGSEVIAVASGVVTFAGRRSGYGYTVEISHGRGLVTRYAHHQGLLVKTGDVVKKGEAVGLMGSTGRSTGPHVHFEVERNGRAVDPARFLKGA